MRWLIESKVLQRKQSGVTVHIEQRGNPVATIEIESNAFGDGVQWRKTTEGNIQDGELPTDDHEYTAPEILRAVLTQMIEGETNE